MQLQQPVKTGLALVGAFGVLTLAAFAFGHVYTELCLPLYREVAGWLLPEYRVVDLVLRQGANETVLALTAETVKSTIVGLRYLPAGTGMTSATLAGHGLQHPVILFSLLLAWPLAKWQDRFQLMLIGFPALLIVSLLDTPFVLAGALQDLVLGTLAPVEATNSWLIRWMHFLNGGGRLALPIAAALLVVTCYNLCASKTEPAPPADR